MRLKLTFKGNQPFNLTRDYRRYFISLLKRIFQASGLDESIYSKKEYKPYTFSVWLGKEFEIEKEIKNCNILSLLFSSGDPEVVTHFYNGALALKKRGDIIFNKNNLTIADILLLPYRRINTTSVLFKTIGISVLNDPSADKKDFKKWYIIPNDDLERFNECLLQRTNSRYQFITQKAGVQQIRLVLLPEFSIKETIVEHYGGYVRGFRGIFKLEGSPEILQFVYDYGLGIRTGQGFGLLEMIKQGDSNV